MGIWLSYKHRFYTNGLYIARSLINLKPAVLIAHER